MAKRKVIKFVYQGHRPANPGEYHTAGNGEMWYDIRGTNTCFDIYHRVETKEEVIRWRAEYNQRYYFVTHELIVENSLDTRTSFDNRCHNSGNYFQTEEQAQKYIDHCQTFFENN